MTTWKHPIAGRLLHRGRRLFKACDLTYDDDEPLVVLGQLGRYEHLIHELAHAKSLGLEVGPRLSGRITAKLARMGAPTVANVATEAAIQEEARAWAIEWNVWCALAFPLEWDDLVTHAEVQGVDAHQLRHEMRDPRAEKLAIEIVRLLTGLEMKHD